MIELLGFKRAIMLGLLLAVNLAIAAALLLVIVPMKEEADAKLMGATSEISRLQTDIQNIKTELQNLKDTLPQYQALQARGFFLNQDRFYLGRTLEEIKNRSQLSGFSFAVDDIKEIPSTDATAANRRLVASRIRIDKIAALLDTGLFDFVNVIESSFPAHARIYSFSIQKNGDINEDAIQRLAQNPATSLITADVALDWLTMTDIPPPPAPGTGVP